MWGFRMKKDDLKQLISVAKKYYLLEMKQDQIAESENISKSTVSRLINKSRELGYVKFILDFPSITVEDLENELKDLFQLKHVFVSESHTDNEQLKLSNVAEGFSKYLNNIVSDGDTIGVSWGETMTFISKNLVPSAKKDVKVVLLNGGVSNRNVSTFADRIVINFAKNYEARWYSLQTPSFVDNSHIAKIIKQDSKIKEAFDLIKEANVVAFSVGFVNEESVLVKAGYFTVEDYRKLKAEGFIGDICSRYFKHDGTHADGELYERVIGISLEEIKKKEHSICIAIGEHKAESILAALRGGYINTLFTDEETATKIIDLAKRERNTMKAIQMTGIKQLHVTDVETPTPKEDEVLLKVMAVGVCGSDIPRINKKGPHILPIIPGHEFAGEIVSLGSKVSGWKVSDRVTVAPLIPCNECKWCKEGIYSLCEDYKYYGSRNDGAFAQYLAVKANNMVKLSDNVPFDWGATVDPAANAIHACFRANLTENDTVCVFGMGAIGLFAVQYAKAIGVKQVIAVDVNDEKLAVAKECGADFAVNSIENDVTSEVNALTKGEGVSVALEMSGAPIAQVQAVQVTGKMGRVVYLGISNASLEYPKEVVDKILRGQITITGSWNSFSKPYPGKEWTDAVKLMAEGKIDAGKTISHKLELDDVPEVFRKLDEEPFFYNKIMFYPHGK